MEVKQIYELLNTVTSEVLGKTDLVQEDLSNVVEIGNEIFNANAVENYTKALIDHIGRVVFVDRIYKGNVPSVMMDSWEFGSVLEKVRVEMPEAEENESFELEDGQVYEQDMFYKPKVSAKFFDKRVTFEVPISITDKQVKSAFSNATQLNSFLSMILNKVEQSLTVKVNNLIKRTINNFIGETLVAEAMETTAKATAKTSVKAINLLKLYNDSLPSTATKLTATNCILNPEFLRFASYQIKLWTSRMTELSTLFNIGGKENFTPRDKMHLVLLEDFASGAETYLESDTFHNEFVKLPKAETVPFWQGTGTTYGFDKVSALDIQVASNKTAVDVTGVLGVAFDTDALGVTNLERNTPSHRNNKAEFTNFWYKYFAGYFNDLNENFIVFIAQ